MLTTPDCTTDSIVYLAEQSQVSVNGGVVDTIGLLGAGVVLTLGYPVEHTGGAGLRDSHIA